MKKIWWVLGSVGLVVAVGSGCGLGPIVEEPHEVEGKGAQRDGVEESNFTGAEPGLRAQIEALDAANRYRVNLSWPVKANAQAVVLRRQEDSGEFHELDILAPDRSSYQDQHPEAGKSYVYQVLTLTEKVFNMDSTIEVAIPKDFQVQGRVVLPSIAADFNRLFIEADSAILTRGSDFRVEVNEIVARDRAMIDTGAESDIAPAGQPGQSGGSVSIKAKTARGSLAILSRGQNGGAGAPGASGGAGKKGAKGNDAETEWRCDPIRGCRRDCKRSPGNGAPGEQGHPGGQGGPGLPGGDSARVFVEVESSADFHVVPASTPGRGGPGGSGGDGGTGGAGGDPGKNDLRGVCHAAQPGAPGPVGVHGAPGAAGLDGKIQPICLRLGASSSRECEGFR